VVRLKFNTIKALLTSKYWLILSLSGAFFTFFALNRGGIVVFIKIGCVFLIFNALFGEYKLKEIPIYYWITCAICAYLLLSSVLIYPQRSHFKWMVNLVRMLCVVFVTHCLSQKRIDSRIGEWFLFILSFSVCWQFVANHFFKMPYGTFTNPHYLSSFVVLTLPMVVYTFLITAGWSRFIFIPIAIMDAELLLQTGSVPGVVGIVLGAFFVFTFLAKGRQRWYGMIMIFVILAMCYISEYANMVPKIKELIINISKEERVQLYSQAWNKLTENSLVEWIFGHGIGRFPVFYTDNVTIDTIHFIFPHSHVLEIIYLNGLIGVVLIFGGLAVLFISIVNAARRNQDRKIRLLLKCLIIVFLSWLIHCGLTVPFYSKSSLYPLSFILGVSLVLLKINYPHDKKEEIINEISI
jgi:hypothetical protein